MKNFKSFLTFLDASKRFSLSKLVSSILFISIINDEMARDSTEVVPDRQKNAEILKIIHQAEELALVLQKQSLVSQIS